MELKAGVAYKFGIILVNTGNRPVGYTGVLSAGIFILIRPYGNGGWSTKSIAAGDWLEIGNGVYQVQFSAAELTTSGEFDFLVRDNPSGNRFDDYRGNVYIPSYHSQDLYDQQTTILANLALAATSTDMGTALDALLGDKVMDKTVGPWRYTWYTRLGAVLQTHDYTKSVTEESNKKT